MKLRQYKLKHENEIIVAWLEDGKADVGDSVTLKDLEIDNWQGLEWDLEDCFNRYPKGTLWKIEEAYSTIDSKDLKDQHHALKVFGSIQGRS